MGTDEAARGGTRYLSEVIFMSLPRRSGFTLVELLMVVLILGMLLALIFPAINRMRESGRETVCRDQLRQVGTAIDIFAEKQNSYPGWRHPLKGARGEVVPWIVPILENVDRKDSYDHIRNTIRSHHSGHADDHSIAEEIHWPWVELLVCPSDRQKIAAAGPQLSYVGNAGRPDDDSPPRDYRSNGIFLDLTDPLAKKQTSAFIVQADGKANTLLLSENLNANHWGKVGATSINEFDHCILWHENVNADRRINSQPSAGADPFDLARPSSHHFGGVNVVMASGAAKLLSNDTDYAVYTAMLKVDKEFSEPTP